MEKGDLWWEEQMENYPVYVQMLYMAVVLFDDSEIENYACIGEQLLAKKVGLA